MSDWLNLILVLEMRKIYYKNVSAWFTQNFGVSSYITIKVTPIFLAKWSNKLENIKVELWWFYKKKFRQKSWEKPCKSTQNLRFTYSCSSHHVNLHEMNGKFTFVHHTMSIHTKWTVNLHLFISPCKFTCKFTRN